jgi:hypothetical protein
MRKLGFDNFNFYKLAKLAGKDEELSNMISIVEDFFKAGLSHEMDVKEEDVDPEQLKMGIEVEYEHTKSEHIAKKIALDHLAEIPDYYTRLKKMEER